MILDITFFMFRKTPLDKPIDITLDRVNVFSSFEEMHCKRRKLRIATLPTKMFIRIKWFMFLKYNISDR